MYKGVHAFPKSVYLKVNIITQLGFELIYTDVTIVHKPLHHGDSSSEYMCTIFTINAMCEMDI